MTFFLKDKRVEIDESDSQFLEGKTWCLSRTGKHTYVISTKKTGGVLLHRLIMGAQKGQFIDHIDMNGLNNKRDNLRFCTSSQNHFNTLKQENNTSGFKGVSLHRKTDKWAAQIHVHKKKIHLGLFFSREEASRAYKKAADQIAGPFARQ